MIKKISAIVLALVLCLSVIVVPTSAATTVELGSGKIAFALEWDKASYSAGDTAVLSVYMDAADDISLYTGAFIIGLNSSVFSQEDNPIADIKANATTSELFNSYWKSTETNLAWLASTVVTRVQAQNTAEENALYDQYIKFLAARNSAGTHENVANTKDGFYGSEFNPSEPIITIALKVKADVPDGTKVNAAITSGSVTVSPVQTTWKQWTNPGNATTTANIAASDFNLSAASVTATVGATAEPSILEYSKAQIRFKGIGASSPKADYQGSFDVRTVAKISQADFLATFTSEDAAKDQTTGITEFGFVYAAKSNVTDADFNIDTAKAVAMGTATDANYVKKTVTYMQHTGDGADYTFTCLIKDIADADKTDGVNCIAFVKYGEAGEYIFFDAAASVDYTALYDQYMPKA